MLPVLMAAATSLRFVARVVPCTEGTRFYPSVILDLSALPVDYPEGTRRMT